MINKRGKSLLTGRHQRKSVLYAAGLKSTKDELRLLELAAATFASHELDNTPVPTDWLVKAISHCWLKFLHSRCAGNLIKLFRVCLQLLSFTFQLECNCRLVYYVFSFEIRTKEYYYLWTISHYSIIDSIKFIQILICYDYASVKITQCSRL